MQILSLGEKIKKLRKEKNMTLKELAGNRITAAQISHIERDKSYPSQDLLEYFVEKLGVSIDYLLESKDMQARKITSNLLIKCEIYIKSNEFDKAKIEIEEAINIAEEYELKEIEGEAKFLLAAIYLHEKNYELAIYNLEQSFMKYIKTQNFEKSVMCLLNMGKIYLEEGFCKVALDKLMQGENVFTEKEITNKDLEKDLYTQMAYCYIRLNSNEKSLEYAQKVENIEKETNNLKDQANNLLLIGNNLLEMLRFDEAKEYLDKALNLFEEEDKKNELAKTYITLSKIYNKMDNPEEALEYIRKAYVIKKDCEDKETLIILFEYICTLIDLNQFEESKRYSKRALSIAIKLKDRRMEYKALKLYAKIYKKEAIVDVAIENLKKCIDILNELDDKKELANLYFEIAQVYSKISKEDELYYYNKAFNEYKELGIIERY